MSSETPMGALGWIEPPNPKVPADYELTRRRADAKPGYEIDLPDISVVYRWNGNGAWVTGYYQGARRGEPSLFLLHANNGWRLGPIPEAAK